ncbi:hypothetical protein [Bradyrhizobium sp. dw_78]|uniref:hypothetical protein n=1 Tax=Bradyrhizobium sp. dw_78 TaxID=2719793 RepID=UPI001BD2358B|nr:hypothetical protein [Bradyrhizobium sp. dw_78]
MILLTCTGCALSQKPVARNNAAEPVEVTASNPAPAADALPPRFECSDGTISASQSDCLINMAHARLPPQSADQTPVGSTPAAGQAQR